MTRKEVLSDIAERCGIDIDGYEYVITYDQDKMIKFKRWLFEELKKADEEPCEDLKPIQNWIPVSERLPEPSHFNKNSSEWVYVTIENEHSLLSAYVTEAFYSFSQKKMAYSR